MRVRTWIPTLLLTTLLAPSAFAQLEQEELYDGEMWELVAQQPQPAPEPPGLEACLEILGEFVAQKPDPEPQPEGLFECLEALGELVAQDPLPDPDPGF